MAQSLINITLKEAYARYIAACERAEQMEVDGDGAEGWSDADAAYLVYVKADTLRGSR
jgi:hypothetical protein